ncbi:MAG: formate dehydrogenase accessory sulfurtransferase FdhD [Geobacteraceae bacterium]
MKTIHTYINGRLEQKECEVVREFPLVLHVNGRELVTLVASPHDLRFLVAGFLRLQGFVDSVCDFDMLSVCEGFGIANVQLKRELSDRLRPVLTSGCGTGITFTLGIPGKEKKAPYLLQIKKENKRAAGGVRAAPVAIFRLMEELADKSAGYRVHGGIHSAAVGDANGNLLLFAEDIGRHNTLDRIAGEALLKGIDLAGMAVVTSGRVSAEMAYKAALLDIALIASRTSPTDMAIRICDETGITLLGYVRGGCKFTVYSHPEGLNIDAGHQRIPGVTGVILAGGSSTRMGSNKALLTCRDGRFIETIYRQFADLFDEVILVTNTPEMFSFLPCRKVPDLFPDAGPLVGLHSGLYHSGNPLIFAVACDMPSLNSEVIRYIASRSEEGYAVVPETPGGLEPLHAVYSKSSLAAMEEALASGDKGIISFLERIGAMRIPVADIAAIDPVFASFRNINTPEEFYQMRKEEKQGEGSV